MLPYDNDQLSKSFDRLKINPYFTRELLKLKDFSIKRNYDDYTFHCNDIILEQEKALTNDEFTTISKNYINQNFLFDVINKKTWIFSEEPFKKNDIKMSGKISIYCDFNFLKKNINVNGIKDLKLHVENITIFYHEIKKQDVKLSELIQKIKDLAENFKNSGSDYEIENILMFKIFNSTDYFALYKNENLSRKEKLQKYFEKRNLL